MRNMWENCFSNFRAEHPSNIGTFLRENEPCESKINYNINKVSLITGIIRCIQSKNTHSTTAS